MEKRLRLQIKAAEKQQQQQQQLQGLSLLGGSSISSAHTGTQGTSSTAAAAAAAEAAAAELLADEEAAAAAAAAKAAKKAAKKQRQAAAASGAAPGLQPTSASSQATEAAAETGSSRQMQAAATGGPTGQQRSSMVGSGGAPASARSDRVQTIRADAGAAVASPPSEGTAAANMTVPVHDRHPVVNISREFSQAAASSSRSSLAGAQQHQERIASIVQQQGSQGQGAATAAAAPGLAAAPVGVQQAFGSSSEPSWASLAGGAAPDHSGGRAQQTPDPAHISAPMPGVAGLFLQLSLGSSAAATNALVPATSTMPLAEGSQSGGSSGRLGQMQQLQGQGSSRGGATAGPSTMVQQEGIQPTGSNSSNSRRAWEVPANQVQSGGVGSSIAPGASADTSRGVGGGPASAGPTVAPEPTAAPNKVAVVTRAIKVGKECVVCMEARSCVVQLPCRHFCCCEACMELLRGKSQECPMCRTQVTEYIVL
jgi:hypothetical protein